MSKIALSVVVAGLIAVAGASAGTITDIDQIPGSDFGIYGLIVGGTGVSHPYQATSDTTMNGNVAIGYNASNTSPNNVQLSGEKITGNIAFGGTNVGCVSDASCDGGTLTGSITSSSQSALNAVTDARSFITTYSTLTGLSLTGSTICIMSGCGTENAGTTHTGIGGTTEYIYTAANGYNPTGGLTIDATAAQYVVINLGSGSTNDSLFDITLSGGITSDHVLVMVDSSGELSSANAHGGIVNADVVDGMGNVNLDSFTLDGRLYCETDQNSCSVVSNATINSTVSLGAAPEPSTLLLGAPFLIAGLVFRRFRPVAVR